MAYTVRSLDPKKDAADTDVYMVPFAGGAAVQLTASPKGENRPRFSPDGRWLAFLSGRDGKKAQVWLLDRRGGEAVKLTDYKADVSDLAWSPDGKRLALVVGDVDPDEEDEEKAEGEAGGAPKTPKPIVIRRLQFKRDGEGYLRELRQHIHVFDVESKKSIQITSGPYDDSEPVWSPDGSFLAFTSNRTEEPDSNDNSDVFLVEAKAGQKPRALTTSPGTDRDPAFSPDGKWIAYLAGGDPKDLWYATNHVAVVPAAGGDPRALTRELDRNVGSPRFSPDGRSIYFILEDGGNEHLARVPAAGGTVERTVAGERSVQAYILGPKGETVVLEEHAQSSLRGLGLRRRIASPSHHDQRRVSQGHPPGRGQAHPGHQPGRHQGRRLPDPAAGCAAPREINEAAAHDPAHPRRTHGAVQHRVQPGMADPGGSRLRGRGREPPGLDRLWPRLQPRHLGRLGQ